MQLAYERLQAEGSHTLAWRDFYVDKEQEFFKVDPWVYGLGKNRHVLKTSLRYAYDLGVCAKKWSLKNCLLQPRGNSPQRSGKFHIAESAFFIFHCQFRRDRASSSAQLSGNSVCPPWEAGLNGR